jgi:hypothetical protein
MCKKAATIVLFKRITAARSGRRAGGEYVKLESRFVPNSGEAACILLGQVRAVKVINQSREVSRQ